MWKKLLVAPLVFLASLFHAPQTTYSQMITRVSASIVSVTGITNDGNFDRYSCSGFVIAPHYMMTAKHCIGVMMQADGHVVTVIKVSDDLTDLAVIKADVERPALALIEEPLRLYQMAHALGYGGGIGIITPVDGKIEGYNYSPSKDFAPGLFVGIPYIPGMSGGPVVDDAGNVIGIVQQSFITLGYGVQTLTIRAFLLGVF